MPNPRSFIKLADPETYVACPWPLHEDADARTYWVGLFKRHLSTMLEHGVSEALSRGESQQDALRRAESCRIEFVTRFEAFAAAPERFGPVTILSLTRWREQIIRNHGFPEPFRELKHRENQRMLPLLPGVCRRIDSLQGESKIFSLITGVFAGNIFDMGAEAVVEKSGGGNLDFEAVRENLKPRPWLLDDYDALSRRLLATPPYRKAVYFIDNAGSDFLLGAIPLIRHLARQGTRVIIAANEHPTLNDMTIHDVHAWWPRILDTEPSLKNLPIDILSTGTAEPLIDLLEVSPELNAASADADLVILEGMGRGVESNLHARFTCDALNIAMLKDPAVARRVGGGMFDLVCRFRNGLMHNHRP